MLVSVESAPRRWSMLPETPATCEPRPANPCLLDIWVCRFRCHSWFSCCCLANLFSEARSSWCTSCSWAALFCWFKRRKVLMSLLPKASWAKFLNPALRPLTWLPSWLTWAFLERIFCRPSRPRDRSLVFSASLSKLPFVFSWALRSLTYKQTNICDNAIYWDFT